ncbi:MAG: PAS domain-containing protein [Nitrospiraceae bacterium]
MNRPRGVPRARVPPDDPPASRSLANGQGQLQAIIDAYPASVAVIDGKGVILHVNAAWRQFADDHGYQSDSYGIGLNYFEICRKANSRFGGVGRSVAKGIQRLFAGDVEEFSYEYTLHHDSNQQWFMAYGRRFSEGRSRLARVLLTHESITPTRRIIETIRRRDRGLKELLESTPLVPWEADAETWRFTYVGPQVEELLGYPAAKWYEPDFWVTHVHPEDRARTIRASQEYSTSRSNYELQYRMVAKSGQPVWLRDFVTVEVRRRKPRILRGFLCDVTAHAQLQERETLLRLLSESIDEIFWFVEVNPVRLIYISPAVEQIMGWGRDKFYEKPDFWMQCIHEEDRQRVDEAYTSWLNGITPEYKLEFRIILPDGRIRWMADHGALIYDDEGRINFATGIAKDISAEKQAEENLRRLSGQLISAQEEERKRIARDLHDHVSQTLSLLTVELEQLSRDKETTSSQKDVFVTMQQQLRGLSSDIHALSHELHPSKLKHLGLVSALRAMCRDVNRGGLAVSFTDHEIPRDVPDDVSLTLYRVMQEGLQNVRKHSGATSVEADLSKISTVLILRLRDKGKGFDPKKADRGEGLGLLSMRERLNAIGGALFIHSAPGEGTLVEARVPLSTERRLG